MTPELFQDCVSTITDRTMSELNRRACMGLYGRLELASLGISVTGFHTRDQIHRQIHEAARRTDFAVLRRMAGIAGTAKAAR